MLTQRQQLLLPIGVPNHLRQKRRCNKDFGLRKVVQL